MAFGVWIVVQYPVSQKPAPAHMAPFLRRWIRRSTQAVQCICSDLPKKENEKPPQVERLSAAKSGTDQSDIVDHSDDVLLSRCCGTEFENPRDYELRKFGSLSSTLYFCTVLFAIAIA